MNNREEMQRRAEHRRDTDEWPIRMDVYYQLDDVARMLESDRRIIETVLGRHAGGGCGMGCANFGNRDLEFHFRSFDDAVAARARLESGNFNVRTRIMER